MRILIATLLALGTSLSALAEDKPAPAEVTFTTADVSIFRPADTTKEVSAFSEGSFQIAGALRTPKGERPKGGFPAVLFISGSGSQTHDGRQPTMDLGTWELLDALANAGLVVLSTDDRGVGKTPLGPEGFDRATLGYDDLVGDARSALTWLCGKEGVRRDSIFVIGHSEGGLTAPILANEGGVAGVVFMAAMGRNLYETTLDQVRNALEGQPEAMRDQMLKLQVELMDAVKERRDPNYDVIPEAMRSTGKQIWTTQVKAIRHWWGGHFRTDVPAVQKAVPCPCFVAQGASDMQVTVDDDAKSIVRNLLDGKSTDVSFKTYDDLDHLFKPCGGRKSSIAMYSETRAMNRAFIADVVAWITHRTK